MNHFTTEPRDDIYTDAEGRVHPIAHADCECGIRIYGNNIDEVNRNVTRHELERRVVEAINRGEAHRVGAAR